MPLIAVLVCLSAAASDLDEFTVKREPVFEFVEKPTVLRSGDRVTIQFATKGFCDVTVAVEDETGTIVRHLASGVLGPNAPDPFRKNAKAQVIVWDGKDDAGAYIDDTDRLTIRVSLGLAPHFERQFLWSPYRRVGGKTPVICPQPEGVYVFEGGGFDHLRLFDHQGRYVRAVYPFPADKTDGVVGLKHHTFPQSGRRLPLKTGFYEATLLTSGYTAIRGNYGLPSGGTGATAMAVRKGRIFLPCLRLNRIASDGSSGGMPLAGPKTSVPVSRHLGYGKYEAQDVPPRSAAVSPDGRWLYLAGFGWDNGWYGGGHEWIHGVARMDPLADKPPVLFAGSLKQGKKHAGADNQHFKAPTSVACDATGRVYVADHFNNRIQVFDPSGRHLKAIPITRPSEVAVDQRSGHIYVFSWVYRGRLYTGDEVEARLTHLGPFDEPRRIAHYPLPLWGYRRSASGFDRAGGLQYHAAIDSWTSPPTIWLVPGQATRAASWERAAIVLLQEKDGALVVVCDFGREARRRLKRLTPPAHWRQRLYVCPTTGVLYVGEGDGAAVGKSFNQLIAIDPATGRHRLVDIPFSAEDMAFDLKGRAYLRTIRIVARYDADTWREIPFDYGEERERVGYGWMSGVTRSAYVKSGIPLPSYTNWHQGGICVSPRGRVAVASYGKTMAPDRRTGTKTDQPAVASYQPTLFPGRVRVGEVHIWDEHGRILHEDAVPGLGILDGIGMDKDDNLYVMAAATRVFDGTPYFDYMTGTLTKVHPKDIKIVSVSKRARIALQTKPKRAPELADGAVGTAWAEGAKWFYGGLGFTGKDGTHASGGCACWNARFTLDAFGRSFAPETQHYSVAVLDTNGNVILRLGRYGNVDDGLPPVKAAGLPNPRPLGGDEVGLFYPAYLATHTDRRLFIADPGNARIVSVRLNYHTTERVALGDVPGQ